MNKKDAFWKRAFTSVRNVLNRPIGGTGKPSSEQKEKADTTEAKSDPSHKSAPASGPSREYTIPKEEHKADKTEAKADPFHKSAPASSPSHEHTIPPASDPDRKQLWGQDFDIVDEGLSETQVAVVVDNLISKCMELEEQQRHLLSLGSLTERAAIDADKAAATIKTRIRGEAEAEAAMIIAQANGKSHEMMAEAKKLAQEATRQEAEDIIQAAHKRGAIIEMQARQQAQQFQIRSRETIESDINQEVKESYYRILAGLQNVMGVGNRLEQQWSDKTRQLRMKETFELPGHGEVHTALTAGMPATAPFNGEKGKVENISNGEVPGNEPDKYK